MGTIPEKGNTSITDIANVLLDPATNSAHQSLNSVNPLNYDSHFSGMDNGYQSEEDIKSSRHKENLPFQEWTAKYHQ